MEKEKKAFVDRVLRRLNPVRAGRSDKVLVESIAMSMGSSLHIITRTLFNRKCNDGICS
jgi:hypothetical protein